MRHHKTLLTTAIASILVSGAALAGGSGPEPDDSWVSVTGTVSAMEPDRFTLDYGEGEIAVAMHDWETFGKDWPLTKNERVTVYGEVDPDLFVDDRIIDARSVHVEGLNTFFYASEADAAELGEWAVDASAESGDMTFIGTVESVSPGTESFTMDTEEHDVTVFAASMHEDLLDEEGFQQIEPGDRVLVEGDVGDDFFDDADLYAESIVTLSS